MCRNYGQIDVPERPDPSQCHATGKGLEVAVVGEKSTAIIQACDFKGEPFKKEMALLQCELISELTSAVVRGDVRRRGMRSATNLLSRGGISYISKLKVSTSEEVLFLWQ